MRYTRRILFVGDDQEYAAVVLRHLKLEGFLAETANQIDEARLKIQQGSTSKTPFDLVIIHFVDQSADGMDLLAWLQEAHPNVSVILFSLYGHSDESIEVLRPDLDDYTSTPVTPRRIMDLINSVDRKRKISRLRLKRKSGFVEPLR
ncbi:MAG: response regulator [Deltaproteobacteria bacterium]|nr:response regulator [Deltaproteobacteria bacterium]